MRIHGWHVDGFGILHEYRQGGLEPGVTVFLGENEAGKSTLLAFVRAILFGFPRANAKGERSYPPLGGGRHGGSLLLHDEGGGLWTVSRYADARREVGVVRPDGSPGSDADLAMLLGGAGAQVFKSVFAFGLDELQTFDSLTGEGVGNRIFDSTISGAGKSAREVITALGRRQDALLKLRRGEAQINNQVREILAVEGELADARRLVGAYESLQVTLDQESARAAGLQGESDAKQRRKTLVEAFIELRPGWDDLEARRSELGDLPAVDDPELPVQVAGLAGQLIELRAREEGVTQLEQAQAEARAAIDQSLRRLGEGWDAQRACAFDASVAVQDQAREWRGRLERATSEAREATAEREKAERITAERRSAVDRVRAELPGAEPLTGDQIDERETVLGRLRDELNRLPSLRLLREQARPAGLGATWAASVLAALAAAGAAASWFAGYPQLAAGLAVAAVLLAIVGLVARARSSAGRGAGRGEAPGAAQASAEPGVIAGVEAAVAEMARSLELPETPTPAELSTLEARLRSERTRCAEWGSVQARLKDAEFEAAKAERLVGEAKEHEAGKREAAEEASTAWSAWLAGHGLAGVTPEGVLDLLVEVKAVFEGSRRLDDAARQAERIDELAATWDEAARRALEKAGRPASGLHRDGVRSALAALDADLRRRETVQNEIDTLERTVSVRLARADDPAAAMDELAAGDPGVWADEATTLEDELEELRGRRDEALGAAREAEVEMRRIEESADVPRLEASRESLRAELAELAREYRVVSAARLLVADTLRAYVRDRQPAVLASASEAFSSVTGGRYVRVVQDEEGELETVVVLGRDDARLTPDSLSRGTQQQLYLSIRLALAEVFAKASAPLPLVMDDCLVNFDPQRAAALAALLAERAAGGQALLFTCHPQTAELMERQTGGPVRVVEMPRSPAAAAG